MSENLTRSQPPLPASAEPETTVVALRGELDVQSEPLLLARLDALTAPPCPNLVLDLRDVSFVDCRGLGILCRARSRALARKGRVRLVTDSPRFLRMLRLTGLSGVFETYPTLPAACSTGPSPSG